MVSAISMPVEWSFTSEGVEAKTQNYISWRTDELSLFGQDVIKLRSKSIEFLDILFKEFQRLKYIDFLEAKKNFVAFKFGLQRHII